MDHVRMIVCFKNRRLKMSRQLYRITVTMGANNDNNAPCNNDGDTWGGWVKRALTLVLIMAIFYMIVTFIINVIVPTCFYAVCKGIFCIVAIAFAPPLVLMSCIIETTCLDALPPLVGRYVADAITVVIVISFLGTWWFVLYDAHRKRNAKSQ